VLLGQLRVEERRRRRPNTIAQLQDALLVLQTCQR
jgi:hypothetical protein